MTAVYTPRRLRTSIRRGGEALTVSDAKSGRRAVTGYVFARKGLTERGEAVKAVSDTYLEKAMCERRNCDSCLIPCEDCKRMERL